MKSNLENAARAVRTLHEDEQGDVSISTIMLLAVAALVILALILFGERIFKQLGTWWDEISGKKISTP